MAELARNFKLIGVNERHGTLFSTSAFELYQTADFRQAVSVYRANNDLALACPGLESGCVNTQLAISYAKYTANTVADFTPIVGDIKAFYDAYKSGNKYEYAAAIAGIVPGADDALGKLLKGGKLDGISRTDFDALDEVKGLTAAQKDQAFVEYVVNTGGRSLPKWKWGAANIKNSEVEEAYRAIANSKTDVDAIGNYLKLGARSRERLENIKDYLFRGNNEIPNFQADPAIATAWHRLRTGRGTDSDKLLLKHEVAEIWLKKNNPGISHAEAHQRANSRYNWEETIPWIDFD